MLSLKPSKQTKTDKTMEKKEINRRGFLRTGAGFAAGTLLLGFGTKNVFGAVNQTPAIPTVKLNNGVLMPRIGFGTNTLGGEVGTRSVADAISVGYRLIDTAHIYGNEEAVGAGIKQSGIDRKELFVTSKLWVDFAGYESTKKAFQTSIDKLGTDYLDLYLIHRPRGDVKGSWKAMEELYKAGKIKAIGVSNFEPAQLADLMKDATVKPAINQIETHVFFQEHNLYDLLKKEKVQHEAWSPFAAGRNNIFSNPVLAEIAKKHNKTIAQVCLRWHFQRGVVAIPRSQNKAHMMENLGIFDFELDKTDMQTITPLDLNRTQFPEWS
jgi:2,5-diketo-D-gluconate reductase A